MMRAYLAQSKVELLRTFRNKRSIFFTLLMPIIFYFIMSQNGAEKMGGVEWKAYFLISMTAYGLMISSIFNLSLRLVQERTQGWSHQLKITPLPPSSYFVAKISVQLLVNLGQIIVMFLVGHFANSVELTAGQWMGAGFWLLLGSVPFLAIGALLGTLNKVETAQIVNQIVTLGLSFIGGIFYPIELFPEWMRKIGELTPSYLMASGSRSILGNQPIDWGNLGILAIYALLFTGLASFILKKKEVV
ncbi:ABC transporter permease [Thermoactinomyces sp. DSM 45892]|uniref:ABC transporter permease n=1 Tax=Thermoactinomyces sp. DSM 45892 TaxID=1882753 RepID=UPI00089C9998|nr:ABC transporter permease [Thermoactinomyces sp. DSM 45892]SDY12117.1 ABC-2 type transport system permease protein [Thermoactinomyces sp. DSM 45892]